MDATFSRRLNAAVSLEPPIPGLQLIRCISDICDEQLVGDDESLREILEREQKSPSPSCGRVFKRDELIYHCKECAVDETCVLCNDCFQRSDHEGHNYNYYLSKGSGGSCDCGELESWKKPLSCPKHLEVTEPSPNSHLPDSEKLVSRAQQVFAMVMGLMAENLEHVLGSKELESDNYSVVLLNDEKHSFPQVIEIVCAATDKSSDFARQIATEVDQQGFTSVWNYQRSTECDQAERMKKIISSIGLRVSLECSSVVVAKLIINGLINWLAMMAHDYPSLRQPLMEAVLHQQCVFDGASQPVVELLFTHERQLWKFYRKTWQELLTVGLQFDFVKMTLLDYFVRHGVSLIKGQLTDRESHLGTSHFAVQILTVPSLAQAAARKGFVKQLYKALFFVEGLTHGSGTVRTNYMSGLVHMLRYVATDDSVIEMGLLHDEEHWEAFMATIRSYDMTFAYSRVIGEHVLYEDEDWMGQINLSLMLLRIVSDFTFSFPNKDAIFRFLSFIAKYELADEQNSGRASFQQPSVWLLGSLLQRYRHISDDDDFGPVPIPPTYVSRVMTCLSLLSEVRSGYWIRNGIAVRAQAEIAVSSTAINSLYLTVFWHASASNPDVLRQFLDDMLPLVPRYQDEQANVTILLLLYQQVILASFCGSDVEVGTNESLEVALVHALSDGPKTFSKLKSQISGGNGPNSLVTALLNVANLLESDSILSNAQYHLKSESVHKFNQYYWGFQASARQKAFQFLQHRFKIKPLSLILAKKYPNSYHIRELFSTLGYYTLQHLMQHCLQGPSYLKLLDDFVALALFVQQVTGSLEECARGHDGDDVFKEERTKDVLVNFVRQSDAECREGLVDLFSHLIAGFNVPADVDESTKRQGRELAEARRQKMLDSMRQAQETFACTNADALTADGELVEMEHVEMVENGTCVVCTEPADYNTEEYGLASYAVGISLRSDLVSSQSFVSSTRASLVSCFHLMHQSCYNRLKQSSEDAMANCPLCSFPAHRLFPVNRNPPVIAVKVDLPRIAKSLDDDSVMGLISEHCSELTMEFLEQVTNAPARSLGYLAGCAQQLCFLESGPEADNVLRMANCIRASVFANQDDPGPLKVTNKNILAFMYRMYLNFSKLEESVEKLPYLVSLMKMQIFSEVCSISNYTAADGLSEELRNTWYQNLYSMITMDVKGLAVLVHLWFGQSVLDIPEDARWLFPEFERVDNFEFIKGLVAKSKAAGASIDLAAMVQDVEHPIVPLTFMRLPEEYSDLVMFSSKRCTSCSLGKMSLLCLVCQEWFCANPSCCGADFPCPLYESLADNLLFRCQSSQSMIIDVHQCTVILTHGTLSSGRQRICAIPAPYVDKHGEADLGFK
ncbi:hypothetical protein PSACC_03494 [Paramicrosporidium saccamoebae]|uniref:E3 ubiquitin-protein ligase n=1 Tax=Paramicrosporidium saccamoebae TaxID=1246581 RepID=A0A2H9TGK2_9FUNG|nr:hypothetical protein PSACC_03494 [Paramicrosporidium saccamoebae]